jgi:hypothetical protein
MEFSIGCAVFLRFLNHPRGRLPAFTKEIICLPDNEPFEPLKLKLAARMVRHEHAQAAVQRSKLVEFLKTRTS